MSGFARKYLSPSALKFFAKIVVAEKVRDRLFVTGCWPLYHWWQGRSVEMLYPEWGRGGSLRASVLFTTTTGLFSLIDGRCRKLLGGRFTGLTRYRDRYYMVEELFHTKRCRVLSFGLLDGRAVDLQNIYHTLDSGGFHQLDFVDDLLYLTDTHNNNIIVLDARGVVQCRIYPNRIHTRNRPNRETDSKYYCHYNSIFGKGEEIYVLAHNETSKTGAKSKIYVIDKNDYTRIDLLDDVECGGNSHNIIMCDDGCLVCDSMGGRLLFSGRPVFETRHFTRGLAMNDEIIAIGCSERVERQQRTESSASIWFLDRKFNAVANVELGPIGQIYDIRFSGLDYGLSNAIAQRSNSRRGSPDRLHASEAAIAVEK